MNKSKIKNTWNYIKDFFRPKNLILTTTLIGAAIFPKEAYAQSGQAHLHGKITGGTTTIGIENVEVKYKQLTPNIDSIITNTNNNGEYEFSITDVQDEQETEIQDLINFYTN